MAGSSNIIVERDKVVERGKPVGVGHRLNRMNIVASGVRSWLRETQRFPARMRMRKADPHRFAGVRIGAVTHAASVALLGLQSLLCAQPAAFEVASIKRSAPDANSV